MLTVTIPVADKAKPHRVQIRTGAGRQVVEPASHPDTGRRRLTAGARHATPRRSVPGMSEACRANHGYSAAALVGSADVRADPGRAAG